MLSPVETVPPSDRGDASALALSTLAVAALLSEAELTPKPALVDRRGNGAHHDLDLGRLRRSALALHDGFAALARAASLTRNCPHLGKDVEGALRLREEIGRIGRDMERRMLEAAGGSNAHRGAIWALGLLVAAARLPAEKKPAAIAAAAGALARLPDPLAPPRPPSHGERARLHFGAAGARGEAQAAFPHVIRVGLPALRAARSRGVPEERARLDALLALMASLDDTCLLHRGGLAALRAAQRGARAVLAAGGTAAPAGWERLHQLHADLMARWASPGGSADLLSATLFLDRLEDGSPTTPQESSHGNLEL
jgi:triphosphoribosyl-dephospho-CoA synthase